MNSIQVAPVMIGVVASLDSRFEQVLWVILLIGGIYGAIHGLTAETIKFRPLGWLPGQERKEYKPKWYERAIMAVLGIVLAIRAVSMLAKTHLFK